VPTPIDVCDNDFYCTRDPRDEITGAGMATLADCPQRLVGKVYLVTPGGTVDTGAAGIGVSGDLFVGRSR
jgi:hypothetical protein